MDADTFDALTRSFSIVRSRRGVLPSLVSGTVTLLAVGGSVAKSNNKHVHDAGKHKKKKKKKCASAGQTPSKKRKQCCAGLVKDGSGVCARAACVPRTCPADVCGSLPDGCEGTLECGCAPNHLCVAGVCQACTVTCPSGIPTICGEELQAALNEGGTVYVCPGRYQGNFILKTAATVIGAGQGATTTGGNTILQDTPPGRVVQVLGGTGPVVLERLRITGGNGNQSSGGISHLGTLLQMRDCTVTGNTAQDGSGGGIFVNGSKILEMTRCTIRDNHAGGGGGIYSGGTTTLTDCLVEDNDALGGGGGGIEIYAGVTTLAGSTIVRGNKADLGGGIDMVGSGTLTVGASCLVTGNIATSKGGGILKDPGTTVNLASGSLVCGNTAPTAAQCSGFTDVACQVSCPP